MEIVKERLEREFGLALIATAPSVEYRVTRTDGDIAIVDNPLNFLLRNRSSRLKNRFSKCRSSAPLNTPEP